MAMRGEAAQGTYNCPVEIPIDVLGGKWKLVLVFHLLAGPARNGELMRLVRGITQKMLTQQLRELERAGIVVRTVYEEVPSKVVYEIAPDEAEPLRALLQALCSWANYWAERAHAHVDHAAAGPGLPLRTT